MARSAYTGASFEAASRRLKARGQAGERFDVSATRYSGKDAPPACQRAHRFVLMSIVALGFGAQAQPVQAQPPLVKRVHGIATGLAACWRPAHDDDQVTVRMSFTRDGAVIGEPRIVYVHSSGGAGDDSGLAQSMLAAVRHCTPLHFSARLGSAIAGQVLDIRFVGRSRATIVAPP
ncbi:MAG TPA: hypothetical protein VIJ63_02245 [Roseiarcus sp.]